MKRSEINSRIQKAKILFQDIGFKLPPFAFYSPSQWEKMGEEADEIRNNGLGWDVTDYGLGDFASTGLLLFTLRNGNYLTADKYPKGYAEKIMVIEEGQLSPMHFHWKKREDIINRWGGNLQLKLYLADENEQFSQSDFSVSVDGIRRSCQPGAIITLAPGESICLEPFVYHEFYAEPDTGSVVIGEVSDVNDDKRDNRFLSPIGRFPEIVEDEPPLHLLCTEYPSPNLSLS
jgi:D-lyxose ketol-isomerase